jgi:uncharacterized membrane protein
MSEEQNKEKAGSESNAVKYVRWFFVSIIMIVILYTTVMAVMRKFGGA